jgi:hypothetical protein
MRKYIFPFVAALCLAALPVQADRGPGGRGGYGGHSGYEHHGGGGSGWAGLAVFGALTGLAIMAEQSRPVYVDPYYVGPVYSPPPVYIQQPAVSEAPAPGQANVWYYCGSSAMYYPYTKACPEGWQAVPARPY